MTFVVRQNEVFKEGNCCIIFKGRSRSRWTREAQVGGLLKGRSAETADPARRPERDREKGSEPLEGQCIYRNRDVRRTGENSGYSVLGRSPNPSRSSIIMNLQPLSPIGCSCIKNSLGLGSR